MDVWSHPSLKQDKAGQVENQQLFLDPWENWANCFPQNCRDTLYSFGGSSLPEDLLPEELNWNLLTKRRNSWIHKLKHFDEWLEVEYGQLVMWETPGSHSLRGIFPHIWGFYLQELCQIFTMKTWERSSPGSVGGGREWPLWNMPRVFSTPKPFNPEEITTRDLSR